MAKKGKLFIGVDVGGTKILAVLATAKGQVLARNRMQTPRDATQADLIDAFVTVVKDLRRTAEVKASAVEAIGMACPAMVDSENQQLLFAPNVGGLTGLKITGKFRTRMGAPVALGNDVNCGTLGEHWLGAARGARSAVGIFVGTGIGGGLIVNGKMYTGSRDIAGEIGHILMQIGGPKCGCGARGCLEALASRTAIERDIREAIKAGKKSILTELTGGDLSAIRSNMLKKALKQGDAVVTAVMHKACTVLGMACLSVRHLLDPEVIVLGGGVVEACGKFMLPVVDAVVAGDTIPGARKGGLVVESELGDDAVALGAVALAMDLVGQKRGKGAKK